MGLERRGTMLLLTYLYLTFLCLDRVLTVQPVSNSRLQLCQLLHSTSSPPTGRYTLGIEGFCVMLSSQTSLFPYFALLMSSSPEGVPLASMCIG